MSRFVQLHAEGVVLARRTLSVTCAYRFGTSRPSHKTPIPHSNPTLYPFSFLIDSPAVPIHSHHYLSALVHVWVVISSSMFRTMHAYRARTSYLGRRLSITGPQIRHKVTMESYLALPESIATIRRNACTNNSTAIAFFLLTVDGAHLGAPATENDLPDHLRRHRECIM